jgi:hypothetical protein
MSESFVDGHIDNASESITKISRIGAQLPLERDLLLEANRVARKNVANPKTFVSPKFVDDSTKIDAKTFFDVAHGGFGSAYQIFIANLDH